MLYNTCETARMALGARITEARTAAGLDQQPLCDRVNGCWHAGLREKRLTQQALSNLETRDSLTSEFAVRIADALGVSIRWLLDGQGDRRALDWPFPLLDRSLFDDLDESQKGYVQSKMEDAIREVRERRARLPPQSAADADPPNIDSQAGGEWVYQRDRPTRPEVRKELERRIHTRRDSDQKKSNSGS